MPEDPFDTPLFKATIDLLRRVGALTVRIGFNDEGEPTVWFAAVETPFGNEADGALNPVAAVLRLASEVAFCWYRFDPELTTYRRTCEGRT
jgi:hypothetical protein